MNALSSPMGQLSEAINAGQYKTALETTTTKDQSDKLLASDKDINPGIAAETNAPAGFLSSAYEDEAATSKAKDSQQSPSQSSGGMDWTNTNFSRMTPPNQLQGKVGMDTWVDDAAFYNGLASQVLNVAGLAAKGLDAGSNVTGTIGALGTASSLLGTGYSGYKAFTGTADEKKQAYGNLGQTAALSAAKNYIALDSAATSLANAGSTGATATASGLGGALSVVGGTAMPWYAATKAAGMGGQAVVANNPKFENTPFDYMSESASEPLTVEQSTAKQLANQGAGSYTDLHKASNTMNPIGGGLDDAFKGQFSTGFEELNKGLLNQVLGGAPNVIDAYGAQAEKAVREAEFVPTPLGIPVPQSWVPDWVPIPGCFLADTMIEMADGTSKAIQDIELLDECLEGGTVTGIGVILSQDLYDYNGIKVTGCHAVCEDGWWYRVEDAHQSIKLDSATHKVYIVNNNLHKLIINDILFADFSECENSVNMTAKERIDYLNANLEI